jgi:hypothetical protein
VVQLPCILWYINVFCSLGCQMHAPLTTHAVRVRVPVRHIKRLRIPSQPIFLHYWLSGQSFRVPCSLHVPVVCPAFAK